MGKITLQKKLDDEGSLSSNILVSSTLIKSLDVYGFINSCDEGMVVNEKVVLGKTTYLLNRIVNRNCSNPIISSSFLYQVMEYFNGSKMESIGYQSPIYKNLHKCTEDMELNVEDLWIPSLYTNDLYKKIKSRIGSGVCVSENEIKKAKLPSNISAKEGKAIISVEAGTVLMNDSFGEIKSIGEDILVVCRYMHTETGRLCYIIYGLDELFYEGL